MLAVDKDETDRLHDVWRLVLGDGHAGVPVEVRDNALLRADVVCRRGEKCVCVHSRAECEVHVF